MATKHYSRRDILVTTISAGLSTLIYPLISVNAGDLEYGPSTGNDASYSWPKNQVKQLQQSLKKRGFDPGDADGKYGPRTASGIREYQSANHMTVNGQISDELLDKLGIN